MDAEKINSKDWGWRWRRKVGRNLFSLNYFTTLNQLHDYVKLSLWF